MHLKSQQRLIRCHCFGLITVLALLVMSVTVIAQTKEWTGNGSDNKWSSDDNWSPAEAPEDGNVKIYDATVSLDLSPQLAELEIGDPFGVPGNGGVVLISGGSSMNVSGLLNWSNVELEGAGGRFFANGNGTIRGLADLGGWDVTLNGNINTIAANFQLTHIGSLDIQGTLASVAPASGTSINDNSGAAGQSTVNVFGTLRAETSNMNIGNDLLLNISGNLEAAHNTLSVSSAPTFTGGNVRVTQSTGKINFLNGGQFNNTTFNANYDDAIHLQNGNFQFQGTATVQGDGAAGYKDVVIQRPVSGNASLQSSAGGRWHFDNGSTISGQLTIQGAVLFDGLIVEGQLTNEHMNADEVLIGDASHTGGLRINSNGQFTNQGKVTHRRNVTLAGGNIVNESEWILVDGAQLSNLDPENSSFTNNGQIIRRSTSNSTVILTAPIEQSSSGSMVAESGVLRVGASAGDGLNGQFIAESGGRIEFGNTSAEAVELRDVNLIADTGGEIAISRGYVRQMSRTTLTGSGGGLIRHSGGIYLLADRAEIQFDTSAPFIIDHSGSITSNIFVVNIASSTAPQNIGAMRWLRGDITSFTSKVAAPSTFTNQAGGIFEITGGGTRTFGNFLPNLDFLIPQEDLPGVNVRNFGNFVVRSDVTDAFTLAERSFLQNGSGGTIDLQGNASIHGIDSDGISNDGTLVKSGGTGNSFINPQFEANTGTVLAQSGTIKFRTVTEIDETAQSISGGIWHANGGTIEFLQLDSIESNLGATFTLDGPNSNIVGLEDLQTNNGILRFENGATFEFQNDLTMGDGSRLVVDDSTVTAPVIFNEAGSVTLVTADANINTDQFDVTGDLLSRNTRINTNATTIQPNGHFAADGTSQLDLGNIQNSGQFHGRTASDDDVVEQSILMRGDLDSLSGSSVHPGYESELNEGDLILGFSGAIQLEPFNDSEPDEKFGVLGIDGNATFEAGSALVLDAGYTDETWIDQLILTGIAELAGDLQIDIDSSFDAQLGESFTLLQADGGILGEFANFTHGSEIMFGSHGFLADYQPTSLTVTVTAIPEPTSVILLCGTILAGANLRRVNHTSSRVA